MSSKKNLADRVAALARSAEETGILETPRHFTEIENMATAGATEVARLTLVARSHEWTLGPVMRSLEFLRTLTPEQWEARFLVAVPYQKGKMLGTAMPHFNWRDSPVRKYADFNDFYKTELETTFGKWSKLQALWQDVVDGRKTEKEATAELRDNGGDRRSAKFKDQLRNTKLKSGSDTVNYILARLDRDGHAALAAQVRAETLSANAAAIAVGYRKESTPLDLLRKSWKKASKVERQTFRNEIGASDHDR
jgi:hypothetical protein